MKMNASKPVLILLAVLPLAACTAKYEDAIRDRDAQIREMQRVMADLRTENADLRRKEREAREAAASLRSEFEGRVAEAAVPNLGQQGDLSRLREDLGGDLDVRYSRGRISIGIPSTVTFASGSATLTQEGVGTLERVAKVLREQFSGRRIYVEGHTDTDPIRATRDRFRSNRHLSAERADAVAAWLVEKGRIPAPSLAIVGYGEHDPLPGVRDKARNRRVEIVIGD